MGFNPKFSKRSPANKYQLDLLFQNQNAKFLELQKKFPVEGETCYSGVCCIDEISLMGPLYCSHINSRMKEVRNNDLPFGNNDMVFCGDFNQIPAIGKSFPKSIYEFIIEGVDLEKYPDRRLEIEGTKEFLKFTCINLIKNRRALEDQEHINRINALTDYSKRHPVTDQFIEYLKTKQLTTQDIMNDNG